MVDGGPLREVVRE
jgi:hypothetical protein